MVVVLVFFAITDSRPCAFRRPSMVAGYFLLLAQKKVTKENGTLGDGPHAERAVRNGRTGFFRRPSVACGKNRRDPSRRPRAVHAAGPFVRSRGFRGNGKSWIPACAGMTRCGRLLRQGLPRLALPGPSRPRRAGEGKVACTARERRQEAGEFDVSTWTYCRRTPSPAREVTRARMRA